MRHNGDMEHDKATGFLSFDSFTATVSSDAETLERHSAGTRAETALDDYTVEIRDAQGNTIRSFAYGNRPEGQIELETGVYTLRIFSRETPQVAWESPVYAAEKVFTIRKGELTTLDEVVCRLANIKITVEYSADIVEQLDETTTVSVTIAPNTETFGFTETRAAYFKATNSLNRLDMTIKGRIKNSDGEWQNVEMTSGIPDVKAGQWRRLRIVIELNEQGNVSFGVKVDTWTYDEKLTFDTAQYAMENIIEDEIIVRPQIGVERFDIESPIVLTDADFDAYGDFNRPFPVTISAENGIASLSVSISSTSGDFLSALAQYGIDGTLDMFAPEAEAAKLLAMLNLPCGAAIEGRQSLTYNLRSQIGRIASYKGRHTFEITAGDAKGGTETKSLVFDAGGSADDGPISVALEGYDIDVRHTLAEGMQVKLDITAAAGISVFTVTIVSDTLTPAELAGVGLTDSFDLINPGDLKDKLEGLGFPTGDAVKNKTTVPLSITDFVPLLMMTGAGDHDFVLHIEDNAGNAIDKTLMLHTN